MTSIGDVISLVQLGLNAIDYVGQVARAPKELVQSRVQLNNLKETMKQAQDSLGFIDEDGQLEIKSIIEQFKPHITDLTAQVQGSSSSDAWKITFLIWLWPSKKNEINEIYRKIDRLYQQLSMRLQRNRTSFGDKLKKAPGVRKTFHVARVYCDHQSLADLDNYTDIIMSLWIQLYYSIEFKLTHDDLKNLELRLEPGEFQTVQEEVDLRMEIFDKTMAQGGKTILILDGLDEVPEEMRPDLIRTLRKVQKENKQCRLIVTSRPYASIRDLFETDPQFELKADEIDIRLYVEDRISRSGKGFFQTDEIANYITEGLTSRCKGIFLMAKLCMDEVLNAATEHDVKAIMEDLPQSLQDAYDTGLKRLSQMSSRPKYKNAFPCHAIQVLFWVAFLSVPMTERELRQALAVEKGDADYDKTKEFHQSVDSLCGNLVVVDPSTTEVRVAHKSITDHLKREETRKLWFPNIREHIHITLMECLLFECVKAAKDGFSGNEFRKEFPLVAYAVKNWGLGLGEIIKPNTSLWKTTERFLKSPFDQWNGYMKGMAARAVGSEARGWKMQVEALSPGNLSALHWVVRFNLQDFVPIISDYEKISPVANPVRMTPLGLAAAQHRLDMVKTLLESGADINAILSNGQALRPPIYDAIYYRNEEATIYLLKKGADPTLRRVDNDLSALDLAYGTAREEIAWILAKSISGHLPTKAQELQFLVKGAFTTQLRKALDEGLDVNHPCEDGKRALDYAYELGDERVIDILTTYNATPKLVWPAFQVEPSPHPQNLPKTVDNIPVIIAQKSWEPNDTPQMSWDQGLEEDEFEGPKDKPEDENQQGLGMKFTRVVLLEVRVDERLKLPLQRIVFESSSKDQGWSDHSNKGTYLGSTRSWIDVCVEHQAECSLAFPIQYNVHASDKFRLHTNVWNLSELELSSPARAQFMRSVRYGDKLIVSAHAHEGTGWKNKVEFIRVRVYGTEGEMNSP
ncbi:hypothetical protein F5Y04DRAFT_268571 [Hypomontagnella monticulosa]|nr:hypothetical protein F5Y04DRAFT_268571 [Hypomontagnella monticulosa]